MSTQSKVNPVSIQDFTAALRKIPAFAFDGTDQVFDFLKVTPVVSDTLAPYLNWDRQHYTRNLIDKTPLYELIAICWEVGQTSSVHNHQGQNCWMAVPMGRLLVQNYRTISQDPTGGKCKLESTNRVEMNPGNPCRVDPRELCTASLILANSMSELSACTSIRGQLIPAWSTHRRKVPVA